MAARGAGGVGCLSPDYWQTGPAMAVNERAERAFRASGAMRSVAVTVKSGVAAQGGQ